MAKRKLEVEILSQEKGSGFKDAERHADGFGKKLGNVAKGIAIGAGVVGVAAVGMGLSFVHAAEESVQVGRQTNAVIKSMGDVAGISAKGVGDLAESLAMKTGIDDEVIQSGENVLLTFGNVRNEVGKGNDVFTRASTVALDMSVALGTDLSNANVQLGKALNDPVKGITALTRSGVSFSQQQKDQITDLVKHHDLLGAQKLMLGEVEKQFSGSAEAQATASGKMSVAWGNLQEELGMRLLPVFNMASDWILKTGIPALEDLADWVQAEVVPVLQDFAGWVGDEVVPVLQDWGTWLGDHVLPVLRDLGDWLTGTAIPALGEFAGWLNQNRDVLAALAIGAGAIILAVLVPAFIAWAVAAGTAAIATLAAAAPFILLGVAVAAFAFLVIHNWDTIKSATMTAFHAVTGFIGDAIDWVKRNWPLLLAVLTGPFGLAAIAISRNWQSIKDGATGAVSWVKGKFDGLVDFITGLPGRIATAAIGMFRGISDAFKGAINRIINWWNGLSFPSLTVGGQDPLGPFGPSLPTVTIGGWDLPNIPNLARGAILRARPGGVPFIGAEAGHDEAVIPLDGRHQLGGQTIINVNRGAFEGAIISSEADAERWVVGVLQRAGSNGTPITFNGRRI